MDAITKSAVHADGIYFGLSKEAYLADTALGSHDMIALATSPPDFWWRRLRPDREPDDSTEAQEAGTAVHLAVLEGREAFEARYMRGPDQDGMSTSEKTQSTKNARKLAADMGRVMLRAKDYDRCLIAAAMIMKNPALATAFIGGAAEVSVFWTSYTPIASYPIRKKARFDYLKPRGIGDLKKCANQHEIPFERACLNAITNYNYHIQAKHYLDARAQFPILTAHPLADNVAGYNQLQLFDACRKERNFAFQFVFWQGERAPITWSCVISPANPICEIAAGLIKRAELNYLAFMAKFGPHEQWVEHADVKELYQESLPPWFARD